MQLPLFDPIEIPLSQGKFALVDPADYGWLSQWKWKVNDWGYASRTVKASRTNSGSTSSIMAREIMQPPRGFLVDHINGDKLDNRRANLRICTRSQNAQNQAKRNPSYRPSSIYKGVAWHKRDEIWRARIILDGKGFDLGTFADEREAALAYDEAARRNYGEFARCNFPKP